MLKKQHLFLVLLLLLFVKPALSQQTGIDLATQSKSDLYYAELVPQGPVQRNRPVIMQLSIKHKNGELAKHKDFKVVHGHRIHLMSVNEDLRDYQHMHSRPDDIDGDAIYLIELIPTRSGNYQMYVDVKAAETNTNLLLPISFNVPGEPKEPILAENIAPGSIQDQAFADSLTFTTSLKSTPLLAGENVMLTITVAQDGTPFRRLEPTMQAFAHLIGFSSDLSTMIHAHPMGEKLTSPSQRGGPNLMFHIVFPKADKYRLFLQVKVDEQDIFVPFDANVEKPNE